MADCLSLIDTRCKESEIATWTNVSQMTNVIHTETLDIKSVAKGYLEVEPFMVPDLDCRVVGALVYHCCDKGAIHSWDKEVICHLFQHEADTYVALDCWELNPKPASSDLEVCWNPDPCARLNELRCCMMEYVKQGRKKSWSFRDSSGSLSYPSESYLRQMITQAESECDFQCGSNSRCVTYSCGRVC